jgi:hypothetical protein
MPAYFKGVFVQYNNNCGWAGGWGGELSLFVGHTKKKVYVIALCFVHEVSVKTKFYNYI